MKKVLNILLKNKELILVFVISFILSLPNVISICSEYLNFNNFDSQIFALWNYALLNHYIPYRDFFYPYGLLNYYRNYNLYFIVLYYLLSPILLTMLFFLFKKIIKGKYFLYFSFFLFFVFILKVVGFYFFYRYGIFIIFSLFFAYLLWSQKVVSSLVLILIGILLGLSASLVNDQGIYLVTSFLLLYLLKDYIKERKKINLSLSYILMIVKRLRVLVFGFLVGFTPILLFLLYNKSFTNYISYFSNVKEIILISKTPFFPFINSPANIFTILILFTSIIFLFLKILFYRKNLTLSSFFQISLIINILILEQKSIIRSIDVQIVFVSLILLILVSYELINLLKISILNKKIIYSFVLILIVVLYSFKVNINTLNASYLFTNIISVLNNKCFDNNMEYILSKNDSYLKVINFVKIQSDFNGKIFSYPPGNSIFYILLKQKFPYYYSIYESQSIAAQEKTIKYIKNNNINYVILDTDNSLVGDGVPDYVRTPTEFKYILNNYYPEVLIDKYLILKMKKDSDFFNSELLNKVPSFKQYLLNVYLYKIPYSEGLYKYKSVNGNMRLIVSGNVKKVNTFFKMNNISSKYKVIVLKSFGYYSKNYLNFIELQSENGYGSRMYFSECSINKVCIINLSNIPYFYKDRVINRILLDDKFKGEILIYKNNNLSILW